VVARGPVRRRRASERDLRRLMAEVPASPRAEPAAVRLAQLALLRDRPDEASALLEPLARGRSGDPLRPLAGYWLARARLERRDAPGACAALDGALAGPVLDADVARQLAALRQRVPGCVAVAVAGGEPGAAAPRVPRRAGPVGDDPGGAHPCGAHAGGAHACGADLRGARLRGAEVGHAGRRRADGGGAERRAARRRRRSAGPTPAGPTSAGPPPGRRRGRAPRPCGRRLPLGRVRGRCSRCRWRRTTPGAAPRSWRGGCAPPGRARAEGRAGRRPGAVSRVRSALPTRAAAAACRGARRAGWGLRHRRRPRRRRGRAPRERAAARRGRRRPRPRRSAREHAAHAAVSGRSRRSTPVRSCSFAWGTSTRCSTRTRRWRRASSG
jgi:hypothetical protein